MCMNCTKSRSRFQIFEIYIAYYLLLIRKVFQNLQSLKTYLSIIDLKIVLFSHLIVVC